MREEHIIIPARDGYALGATVFHADSDNAPVVIISAASAVLRGYYSKFATFLAENGLTVITFDYRGMGDSRPETMRGFGKMEDWGRQDIAGVIDYAQGTLNPSSVLFMGQSVAGQVVALADNNDQLDAVYLIACQMGYWKHWDGFNRLLLMFLWYVSIPVFTPILGYFPKWLMGGGEDWPSGIVLQWAYWGRHPNYIVGRIPDAKAGFERMQVPVLVMGFTDDARFAPERAVDALYDQYTSPHKERRQVAPADVGAKAIGHFGFFKSKFKDTLWQDALDWLRDKASIQVN